MNSHHTCILLALVLLLSNSALTYPSLSYAYPQKIPPVMKMVVPAKRDTLWSQYEVPLMNTIPYERVRRGWGGGRRRRSISNDDY